MTALGSPKFRDQVRENAELVRKIRAVA